MGTVNDRIVDLAKHIERHPGILPHELATTLEISERTLRSLISRANEALAGVARIELKRKGGYRVIVDDQDAYAALIAPQRLPSDHVPSNAVGRSRYILHDLMWRTEWVTLDDLANRLYVSRSTIIRDIKLVEERLESYGLALERKPYKGIRVVGPENAKRLLLASLAVDASLEGGNDHVLELIRSIIDEVLAEDGISVSSVAYQNMLVHITVALLRIEQGSFVAMEPDQMSELARLREHDSATKIARKIELATGVVFPEAEIAYITIHLAAKQMIDTPAQEDGLVISDEIWDLTSRMIDKVFEEFHFDFRNDLELKMNLARHIVPLSLRLKHRLTMHNPLLSETKRRFPLAYSMARYSSNVLAKQYDAVLSDEELGYIALTFALAIERQRTETPRKNILIVCASGMGTARLLEHRYRSEFGDYLDRVETCDVAAVHTQDFSTIDYVFTTVPLAEPLPVPVREIGFFLEPEDIGELKTLLSQTPRAGGRPLDYFDRALFFAHLHARDKWELLTLLCDRMVEADAAEPDLAELVIERERLFPTSLGDLLAVPHAARPTSAKTTICVGILDEPLSWDDAGHAVQVVLLVSFSPHERSHMSDVFTVISTALLGEGVLERLARDQRWEVLEQALTAPPQRTY